jgi:hypothetical protein
LESCEAGGERQGIESIEIMPLRWQERFACLGHATYARPSRMVDRDPPTSGFAADLSPQPEAQPVAIYRATHY